MSSQSPLLLKLLLLLLLPLQAYVYLSSIAVKDGKVFALFVRSPSRVRSWA
jgi:hypothetical protein